jgi:hypothetical protein
MTEPVQRSSAQRIAIILAVIVQIGASFLPELGLGEPIGNRSDDLRTIITPVGWAFAVWGPLFAGSAIFAIWQALPAQRNNALVDRIGWWALPALGMQGIWAAYTQFNTLTAISVLIIVTALVSLLAILRIMVFFPRQLTRQERLLVAIVFSALAGWLTAATIVNITASLVYYGVAGGYEYPLVGALLVLVGGAIVAVAVARSMGNPWYALTFGWALLGITMQGGQQSNAVAAACGLAAALVLAAVWLGLRVPGNARRWFG